MRRLATLLLGMLACGDDAGPDPSELDGGAVIDARVAPSIDAALRAEAGMDAQARDASPPLPDYAECAGSLEQLHAARVQGRAFSSAVVVDRIMVAYPVATCGGTAGNSHTQGMMLASLKTTGPLAEPRALANASSADCVQTSTPALAPSRQASQLFYTSSGSAGWQVYARSLDDPDAGATQVSTEGGPAPTDLVVRIDNTLTAQVLYARGNDVWSQRVGQAPKQLVAQGEGYQVTRVGASSVGRALAALAWISQSAGKPGAFLRFFDDDAVSQEALLLGTAGTRSALDIASQAARGAVVYSDDSGGLWMRTLSLERSLGAPVRLTSGNQFVSDVSVTRYGIGYAVAFRSTPQQSGVAVIRLLMIDEFGNQAAPRLISEARSDGVGLEVLVANDGRVVILWADPEPLEGGELGTAIKIARLTCL